MPNIGMLGTAWPVQLGIAALTPTYASPAEFEAGLAA
jgi:hypothetical protein